MAGIRESVIGAWQTVMIGSQACHSMPLDGPLHALRGRCKALADKDFSSTPILGVARAAIGMLPADNVGKVLPGLSPFHSLESP